MDISSNKINILTGSRVTEEIVSTDLASSTNEIHVRICILISYYNISTCFDHRCCSPLLILNCDYMCLMKVAENQIIYKNGANLQTLVIYTKRTKNTNKSTLGQMYIF